MNPTKPNKTQFSELEAAAELGVSVDDLRSLIRKHVVVQEEDLAQVTRTTFQPSDLVLLRILAGQRLANAS
jgi:hypothetical protein